MAVPKATEASKAAKPQKRKILYIWYIWMSLHVSSTSIVGQLYIYIGVMLWLLSAIYCIIEQQYASL